MDSYLFFLHFYDNFCVTQQKLFLFTSIVLSLKRDRFCRCNMVNACNFLRVRNLDGYMLFDT